MNDKSKAIMPFFYTSATIDDTKTNLLPLFPDISSEEISKEFKDLALKAFEKAESNKLSSEFINGSSFCKYHYGSRELYINTKNSKEVYLDRNEIISCTPESHIGRINVLKMIESNSCNNSQLLVEIESCFQRYIELKNEDNYTVLAAYTLLTYLCNAFPAIPYLSIKGNKGTGKSTILSIFNCLVNDPYLVSNLTSAALIRITDNGSKTLMLDEAENLSKRGSSNDMIFEILNSGYKKEGMVSRVSGGKLIEYSTYSPKIIAGINELAPTTEDRTIVIETNPNSTGNGIIPYIDTLEQRKELEDLKYKMLFQSPSLVEDIRSELSNPKNFSNIKNRDRERWLPLLLIVKIFSGEHPALMDKIMRAAERDIAQKKAVEKSSPESIAMSTLLSYIQNNEANHIERSSEYICFEASPISEQIKSADVYRKFTNQGQITRFLKSAGVLVDRVRVKTIPTTIYKIPTTLLVRENNITTRTTMDTIKINKVKDEHGFLSCMSAHPMIYKDIKFKTCEALFQWLRFSNHPEIQDAILEEKSPMGAKMRARKHREKLNRGPKWDEAPQDLILMKECLRLKIDQHPDLQEKLIETGDATIVEDCTTHDRESARFWGMVYKEDRWIGENNLGKLWMELRDEIQKEQTHNKKMESNNGKQK